MKNALNRWVVIFLLLVLVIFLNTVAGCTQVPVCERFTVQQAYSQQYGYLYVMNAEELTKLANLIDGINKGTCRLD